MPQGFSKKNQSQGETAYRFGAFEVTPADRLLKRSGKTIAIQPKAFDALLCLLRRAGHLVSKRELTMTLWPSVHVSETNLTNIVVSLRKIVGRSAIRTASKHGYRFDLPVEAEPGVDRAAYERFARAREIAAQRSVESMDLARELLWTCLAEDPGFAPAWAWMGRCSWFLHKFGSSTAPHPDLASAAFQRAFFLDPDLAAAHQFFTFVEVDLGRADAAMDRLLDRLIRHPGEPESLAGLVQVFRFRGLLDESMEAHRRARSLDPSIATSVAHTHFLAGDFAAALDAYGGRAGYYLDAASWAAMGETGRAIAILRERLENLPLSLEMQALLRSLLAVLEDRGADAVLAIEECCTVSEPEVLFYFCRHAARAGDTELAFSTLQKAAEAGFLCSPVTLRNDPWLELLRRHSRFDSISSEAEMRVNDARKVLDQDAARARAWRV